MSIRKVTEEQSLDEIAMRLKCPILGHAVAERLPLMG
jgi:hypothetical protein